MHDDKDIRYMKPKLTTVTHEVIKMELVTSRIMQVRTDTLEDKTLRIPVRANFHPLGYRELIRLENREGGKLVIVATMLVTLLHSRLQNNTVQCTYDKLAELCEISTRTVAKAVPILEEYKYIERTGKTGYKLSAKLAWFGNQVDWAMELRRLQLVDGFGTGEEAMLLEAEEELVSIAPIEYDVFLLEVLGKDILDLVAEYKMQTIPLREETDEK